VHWDHKGLNPIINQSINNPEGYFASWHLCDNEYRHCTVVTQNTIEYTEISVTFYLLKILICAFIG
jgi:hypothetical protein